jgi:hypothetical protein
MRQILIKSLVGSGLALSALTLGAQQYSPQQYPPRSDYYRSDRDFDRNTLINRVRDDLNFAQSRAYWGDRWRIMRAKNLLNEFQSSMNSGDYDRRNLDMAINTMQRLVDNNNLPSRVEQSLSNDVNRLRDLQYRMGG